MKKETLEKLIDDGFSVRAMARECDSSYTTIRYWLKKYKLKTKNIRKRWKEEDAIEAIRSSVSIADVLRKIGLQVRPGNYETIKRFIKKNNIDISHIDGRKIKSGGIKSKSLEEILIKDSNFSRTHLKARLLKEGLLENKCSICGLEEWNNNPIVMILDHENGINNDNEIENLRMVCPNCNSQLDTHCGRNKVS